MPHSQMLFKPLPSV